MIEREFNGNENPHPHLQSIATLVFASLGHAGV
jgi:hypothetical protein